MRVIRTRESHRSRARAFARSRVRSRVRACIRIHPRGTTTDDCIVLYHQVRSPWYMTQCVVYGHEYRYIENQGYEALGM